MSFLDKEGLKYFWEKIKPKIEDAGKTGGVEVGTIVHIEDDAPIPEGYEEVESPFERHIMQMQLSAETDVTTSNQYAKIPFDIKLSAGSKLTFDSSENAIIVGDGVSVVSIRGVLLHKGRGSVNEGYHIYVNGTAKLSATFSTTSTSAYLQNVFPETLMSVNEGDEITAYYRSVGTTSAEKTLNKGTTILVEVVK